MSDLLLTYINGNLSYARDEFWNSSKLQMRDYMLEAQEHYRKAPDEIRRFIRVIFLP